MSLKAMLWVLEDCTVAEPELRVLLFALADRAANDGTSAFPSRAWLAERCFCSVRSVSRRLARLEEMGIIRRGDQHLVDHFRADRRPVVWDLNITYGVTPVSRRDTGDMSATSCRGDTCDTYGVTPVTERGDTAVSHKPSIKPSIEPSISNPLPPYALTVAGSSTLVAEGDPQAGAPTHTNRGSLQPVNESDPQGRRQGRGKPSKRQLDGEFDRFWALVGRKRGKQQARKSFEQQRRTHNLEFICSQIVKAQAEWVRMGREPEYWPHPSTWLNQQLDDDYDSTSVPSQREFYEARVQMLREQHVREKAQLNAVTDDASMSAITSTCVEEDDEDDDVDDWDWGA